MCCWMQYGFRMASEIRNGRQLNGPTTTIPSYPSSRATMASGSCRPVPAACAKFSFSTWDVPKLMPIKHLDHCA